MSDSLAEKIVDAFMYLSSKVVQFLTTQLTKIATLIPDLLLSTPLSFLKSSGFKYIYKIIFILSCTISAAVVCWQAFKIAFNKITPDQFVKHFWQLLFLPIFAYFAVDIVILFISWANQLTESLINVVYNFDVPNSESFFTAFLSQWSFILFIPVYLYYVVKLFLFYAWRNFRLLELAVYCPFIYLIDSMPTHSGKLKKLVYEVISLLATQVAHAIQYIILAMLVIHGGDNIFSFLTQIGCLMTMNETTSLIQSYITPSRQLSTPGGVVEKNVKKVTSKVKRGIKKRTKSLPIIGKIIRLL